MLRFVMLLFTCSICMIGCAGNKDISTGRELLWNGLYSDENQWYTNWRTAETEQGFYLTVNDYADTSETIVYFDKASRKAVPLCSQPNCDHKSLLCDASMRGYMPQVYYYEGRLYLFSYDEEGTYLERMNPDGSGRTRVRTILNEPNVYWQLIMHRDNFYFIYDNKLYALGFTDDIAEAIMLADFPETYSLNQLFAKGDYVYWSYAYLKDEESKNAESIALRYHIPTGKSEELLCLPQGTYVSIAPLTDNDIYYYEVDKGLFCYHPSTGTSDVVYEEKGRVGLDVYSGGKGLYVVNWRGLKLDEPMEEIKVLRDGKKVTGVYLSETPPNPLTSFLDFNFLGNDELLFLWSNDELFYMDLTAEELSWESTGLRK